MKAVFRTVRQAFALLTWDVPVLLLFELGYKFLLLFFLPLGKDAFLFAMQLSGVPYFSTENVLEIFSNPLSVFLYLLLLILLTFAVLIEVFAVIIYLDHAHHRTRIGIWRLFWQALKKAARIFLPHNLPVLLLILVILPLCGVTLSSGVLEKLRLPDFILDFIHQKPLLSFVYGLVIAAFLILVFRLLFSIHKMCLERTCFARACRDSHRLLKGRALPAVACLACWYLLALILALIVWVLTLLMLSAAVKFLTPAGNASLSYWYAYSRIRDIGQVLSGMYLLVCNLTIVSALFYQLQPLPAMDTAPVSAPPAAAAALTPVEQISPPAQRKPASAPMNRAPVQPAAPAPRRRRKVSRGLKTALALILLILYAESTSAYSLDSIFPAKLYIAAHRAGAAMAPENTLAALADSIQAGADYAEIDVQQTKDGQLIILHDASFARTAGVNKHVWDVTLAEVQTYQTGYIIGQGQIRIPTLEQMLQAAKGKIKLMIELKKNGHERQLEEKTIALIRQYGMEDECVIASLDYQILERVRELAPDLQTCYIAAISFGDLEGLTAADMLSIEETFITPSLLFFARKYDKQVFVWTINREDDMRRMVRLGVDGVVTDNPYLADYVIKSGGRDALAGLFADLFFPVDAQGANGP